MALDNGRSRRLQRRILRQTATAKQSNNYTLDGADKSMKAIDNYIGYSPNVDALGEVRIITGNSHRGIWQCKRRPGRDGDQGAGRNQFHGNAFFFGENQKPERKLLGCEANRRPRVLPSTGAMFGGTFWWSRLSAISFFSLWTTRELRPA